MSAVTLARIVELEAAKLLTLSQGKEQLAAVDLERLEVLSRCAKLLRTPVPGKSSAEPDTDEDDAELLEQAESV